MASYHAHGGALATEGNASTAPLVVLYERDDAVAVPLLSQLRLAGYDVRAARTPVDLFDLLGKQLVSLVLVDLGAATAGRREFWVALDGQRRGRALQVMTFRQSGPAGPLGMEDDPSARALADVEVAGPQDYAKIVQGVRQRIPLHGAQGGMMGGTMGPLPLPGGASVVGPSPFAAPAPPSRPFGGSPYGQPPAPYPNPPSYADPAAYPPGYPTGMPAPSQGAYYGQPPYTPPSGYPPQPGYPRGNPPQATPSQAYPPSPYSQQPYGPPPGYPQGYPLQGSQGYPPQAAMPTGAPPWEPSPFANPAGANPYAENSPFAQPYAANPFAGDAVPGGPAPYEPRPPSSHVAPAWSQPSGVNFNAPSSVNPFGPSSSFGERSGFYGPGASDPAGNGFSRFGVNTPPEPAPPPLPSTANISDTWIPPDENAAIQTGIVPEVAFSATANRDLSSARAGMEWNEPGSAAPWSGPANRAEWGAPQAQPGPLSQISPTTRNLPAVQSQADHALGTVLVEGSLLTPSKLEVLRGIQAMLANVRMDYKLGELALLFRFLSPDQLLAALLVSRGLVTPQQIAGLGRVKQELAASGMDHDLESLLIMFHMLSPDQLRQIRAELL